MTRETSDTNPDSVTETETDAEIDAQTYDRRDILKATAALPAGYLGDWTPDWNLTLQTSLPDTLSVLGKQWLSWGGVHDAAEIPTFREDYAMWHVQYTSGSAELLRDTGGWLDSGDRKENRHIPELDESQITASDADIRALAAKSWIESIDIVQTVSLPDPIEQPATPSDVAPSDGLTTYQAFRADTTALESELAFDEDMPTATTADVVDLHNGTATDLGGSLPDLSGLPIASIDTGVSDGAEFEDSTGATRIQSDSKDFLDGETGVAAVNDPEGHGTWTASLMCADAADGAYDGYAPTDNIEILAARALDEDGSGNTADIVAAVRYCADQGAAAACLSLGSPVYSDALDRAISYAAGAGMTSFVAVGNDRYGTRYPASPSDAGDAFGVAACTVKPPDETQVAYFSNHGPDPAMDASAGATADERPDGIAAGCKIEASVPGGYSRLSGTSMAAPSYAIAAVLLQAADSSLEGDPDAIYERLATYAQPAQHIGVTEAGDGGLLDVDAAINETEPDQTQAEARTGQAESRDEAHRKLSNIQGRAILGRLS